MPHDTFLGFAKTGMMRCFDLSSDIICRLIEYGGSTSVSKPLGKVSKSMVKSLFHVNECRYVDLLVPFANFCLGLMLSVSIAGAPRTKYLLRWGNALDANLLCFESCSYRFFAIRMGSYHTNIGSL